jgi:putative membrane protein
MSVSQLATAAVAGLLISLAPAAVPTAIAQSEAAPIDDSTFVQKAGSGGLAEVQLGKLAKQKGTNAEVKQFGQRMVTDHTKSNKELAAAAQNVGLTVPTAPLPKHQKKADKLSGMSGAEFDKAYMSAMVKDHAKQLELFQQEAASGKAESLRQLATKTVPVLEQHLTLAREVAAKVGADTTAMQPHAEQASSSR